MIEANQGAWFRRPASRCPLTRICRGHHICPRTKQLGHRHLDPCESRGRISSPMTSHSHPRILVAWPRSERNTVGRWTKRNYSVRIAAHIQIGSLPPDRPPEPTLPFVLEWLWLTRRNLDALHRPQNHLCTPSLSRVTTSMVLIVSKHGNVGTQRPDTFINQGGTLTAQPCSEHAHIITRSSCLS